MMGKYAIFGIISQSIPRSWSMYMKETNAMMLHRLKKTNHGITLPCIHDSSDMYIYTLTSTE